MMKKKEEEEEEEGEDDDCRDKRGKRDSSVENKEPIWNGLHSRNSREGFSCTVLYDSY